MAPDDDRQTLTVGARFACFACRARAVAPGPCLRCGTPRVDLASHAGHEQLARLVARLPARRHVPPGPSRGARWYRAWVHLFALGCAAEAAHASAKIHTAGLVSHGVVAALAGGLGLLGGYIVASLGPVFALVAATLAAVVIAGVAIAVGFVVALASLAAGAHGAALRARTERAVYAVIAAAFAPARALRRAGSQARRADDDARPTLLRPPSPAEVPQCAPAPRIEGVLLDSAERVGLGSDLSGAIVGALGTTLGAGLADAQAAPLWIQCDDGDVVAVVVDVGQVRVAGAARVAYVGEGAPAQWGIARGSRGRAARRRPPARPVSVWVVGPGARVVVEGGVADETASALPAPGTAAPPARVLRGSLQAPVCVTVADAPPA